MNFNPSGKIKVYPTAHQFPNKCSICGFGSSGTSNDRQFLDIGLDVEFYGTVYFCTLCMTEMFTGLGFVTPETADELQNDITLLKTENYRLSLSVEVINGLVSVLDSNGWLPDRTSVNVASTEPIVNEDEKDRSGNDREADELTDESRSNDLSDSVLSI